MLLYPFSYLMLLYPVSYLMLLYPVSYLMLLYPVDDVLELLVRPDGAPGAEPLIPILCAQQIAFNKGQNRITGGDPCV